MNESAPLFKQQNRSTIASLGHRVVGKIAHGEQSAARRFDIA
jgi:hypothetical protein